MNAKTYIKQKTHISQCYEELKLWQADLMAGAFKAQRMCDAWGER